VTNTKTTAVSLTFDGPLTVQDLNAQVTAADISNTSGIVSGAITLNGAGSSSEFAGIQTVSANTGVESATNAATAVAATASVNFNGN